VTEVNRKPSNFDWVTARHQCSLKDVFEEMRIGIRDDIETRNATLPDDDPDYPTLKAHESANTVRVYWHDMYSPSAKFVEFKLTSQSLSIVTQDGPQFEAFIGLNDDGDCKLKISGKELDLWQVRRKALEPLMFGPPQ
jgi:hypothetical protein